MSNEAYLYFISIIFSSTLIKANNINMIAKSILQKSKSQLWYLDKVYLKYLNFEKNVFIGNLTKSSIGIKWTNGNYLIAKSIENIKLLCLNEDNLKLSAVINNVLNLSKAKANWLFLN